MRTRSRCLYVPDSDGDDSLIDEFVEMFRRPDGSETDIADFVLSRSSSAPSFVVVSWSGASESSSRIRLVVRGDISVATDLPSVPSLSGVGSSTWVEHHVPHRPEAAEIRVGSGIVEFTDLVEGIVSAGGFQLELVADGTTEGDRAGATPDIATKSPDEPVSQPQRPSSTATPAPTVDPTPPRPARPVPEPEAEPAPDPPASAAPVGQDRPADAPRSALFIGDEPARVAAPADATSGLSRLAALNAAAGAEVDASAAPATPSPEPASPVRASTTPDAQPEASGAAIDEVQPPRRPRFDTASDLSADAEVTLHPDTDDDPFDLSEGTPLTDARVCPEGHHNPPHLLRCRTCQRSLDPASSTVTVEQPVLGLAELHDGTFVELTGAILFGRNPKPEAVESPTPDRIVRLDAPASVSRSHVLIVASGWTLTAIDCGSRAGTALQTSGGPEPIALEAWTPHELSGGDMLYLGGPTTITINEVTA